MTVGVVDLFEVVDIKEDQAESLGIAAGTFIGQCGLGKERSAVDAAWSTGLSSPGFPVSAGAILRSLISFFELVILDLKHIRFTTGTLGLVDHLAIALFLLFAFFKCFFFGVMDTLVIIQAPFQNLLSICIHLTSPGTFHITDGTWKCGVR